MVSGAADLSGPGPQQVWIDHRRVGQDAAGNFSTFYVEVRYYGNGYGSWGAGPYYWSADAAGWHVEGSFSIPQANRYDSYMVLYAGYYNRAHDAAGNLGSFGAQASIAASHDSIGSGTVFVTEPASPRIPKRPSPPPFSIDQVTPTSFRVLVQASVDQGGSPVNQYLIRVSSNPQADTPGTYTDYPGPGTQTISGREAGKTYYVTVYAKNSSVDNNGYSTYQASKSVTTLAGVYVSTGSVWEASGLRDSTGTVWEDQVPQISTGTVWEDPIDV